MPAHVQMIFRTSPTTNKARHFRRMYDKKVNVLGLSAVMGLPDAVLPAEVKAGLPQLMAGALTLLVRLRDQEVRPHHMPTLFPAPATLTQWLLPELSHAAHGLSTERKLCVPPPLAIFRWMNSLRVYHPRLCCPLGECIGPCYSLMP